MKPASRGWMLFLLAAVSVAAPAALSSSPSSGPSTSSSATARGRRVPAAATPAVEADALQALRDVLAPYGDFAAGQLSEGAEVYRRTHGAEIFTEIATAPDPEQTDFDWFFDQEIDALRTAARGAGFLPDKFSLPWRSPAAASETDLDIDLPRTGDGDGDGDGDGHASGPWIRVKSHQEQRADWLPGMMLFRRLVQPLSDTTGPPRLDLLIVFVVGETPTRGIHRRALAAALDLQDLLRSRTRRAHVLLAPFFSPSMASLRLALDEHEAHTDACQGAIAISGSANGALGKDDLGAGRSFQSTNHPASEVLGAVLDTLDRYDPRQAGRPARVALLTERTSWGQALRGELHPAPALNGRPAADDPEGPDGRVDATDAFEFPVHIAQLRSEREKVKQDRANSKTAGLRTKLELHLDRDHQSVDEVPPRSPLTPYGVELLLQQQLTTIAREKFRYLGIGATDPADLIFLAGEAHKYCPQVQLFALESSLLFAHPDVMRELNGMLIASTYPLAGPRADGSGANHGTRLAFVSQIAEGIYNASAALLFEMGAEPGSRRSTSSSTSAGGGRIALHDYAHGDHGPPPVWISMVSNGGLWPFAVVAQPHPQPVVYAGAGAGAGASPVLPPSKAAWKLAEAGSVGVFHVVLLLATGILLAHLLSCWLGRAPRHRGRRSHPAQAAWACSDELATARLRYRIGVWFPIAFASVHLLAALYTVPGDPYARSKILAGALLAVAAVLVTLLWLILLVWDALRLRRDRRPFRDAGLAGLGAATLVVGGGWLACLYLGPFVAYDARFPFAHPPAQVAVEAAVLAIDRTLQPLSGVSPALPLLFLAAGLALWGFFGLQRVREQQRFPEASPFPLAEGLASTGLGALAESVRANHAARLLTRQHAVGVAVTAALGLHFGLRLRPTFEGAAFDRLFLAGFLVLLMLVLANAGRMVATWLELRQLLRRLAGQPMADAYDRVSTGAIRALDIELGARVPNHDELEASVRMADLLARQQPPLADRPSAECLRQRLASEVELAKRIHGEALDAGEVDVRIGAQAALFRLARVVFGVLERLWAGDGLPESADSIKHVVEDIIPAEAQVDGPYRHVHTLALYRRLATPSAQIWQRLAEDFVVNQVVTLLKLGLRRIRSMMSFGMLGALLLVCSVTSYRFEPSRFVDLFAWTTALFVMGAILWVVIGIERDEVLSRIAHTRPGHIQLNAAFLGRLAVYGGLPATALLVTSFPQMGAVLLSWTEPLLRALH